MKKEDIFNAFEDLDPKFVEEAAPKARAVAWKSRVLTKIIAIAAAVVLVLGCIIIPTVLSGDGDDELPINKDSETSIDLPKKTDEPDKLEKYKDSEYFEVIQSLDSYYDWLSKQEFRVPAGISSENIQVTDNQTKGVEEADKIKRTADHIFYMDGKWLRIFSIDGENSVEVGSFQVSSQDNNEFFLSDDGKTITVISRMYGSESFRPHSSFGVSYTDVHSLDVSDPDNITLKLSLRFKGGYASARVSDGKLLLFLNYRLYKEQIIFDKPESFLPVFDRGNGFELIPDCEIICNEVNLSETYKIAVMLDEKDLTLEKNIALLGYPEEPYVSKDKIFFSGIAKGVKNKITGGIITTHSRIFCVDYIGEDFEVLGNVVVGGSTKDKWSMDEYDGVLRVVTTTQTSADLYCISLDSFEIIASVEGFAPEGEDVQSVRFEKTNAYVCTAVTRQNLDPVFFFDLSDLNNISYKETGTIEGMSTSLIDYGNGYLIGIGNGETEGDDDNWMLKIEAYKEGEDKVICAGKYEAYPMGFPSDYKSYYINRDNQLLGFGYKTIYEIEDDYDLYEAYILLKYDAENEKFVELLNVSLDGYADNKRGVYIDGYMYMFGTNDFKVEAVDLGNTAPEQPEADGESQE